jgi:hypothetical protein
MKTQGITPKMLREGAIARDPRGGTLFIVGGKKMSAEELAREAQRISDAMALTEGRTEESA